MHLILDKYPALVDPLTDDGCYWFDVDGYLVKVEVNNIFVQEGNTNADNPDDFWGYIEFDWDIDCVYDENMDVVDAFPDADTWNKMDGIIYNSILKGGRYGPDSSND